MRDRPNAPQADGWRPSRRVVIGTSAGAMATVGAQLARTRATSTTYANSPRQEAAVQTDPLQAWNDGPNKQAILDFVAAVTEEGGEQFVPEGDRIATFDNDGTLWTEQPFYSQLFFALDEIRRMASDHPEWETEQPFAAILANDREAMARFSEHEIAAIVAATHAGMTTTQFADTVTAWLATATHPHFNQLYTDCVYQPQLELLDYLRANGFLTFIVSGGGIDFLRLFAEETYGVPPHQVVGSSSQVTYSLDDGAPTLTKEARIGSIDDKAGKPVNIHLHIGKRPILAFGNSDGDLQMLQYTDQGDGPRLLLLVHHDDAAREFAYDRGSHVGALDAAWDEAVQKGWAVVSMQDDWKHIFPWS